MMLKRVAGFKQAVWHSERRILEIQSARRKPIEISIPPESFERYSSRELGETAALGMHEEAKIAVAEAGGRLPCLLYKPSRVSNRLMWMILPGNAPLAKLPLNQIADQLMAALRSLEAQGHNDSIAYEQAIRAEEYLCVLREAEDSIEDLKHIRSLLLAGKMK